MFIPNSILMAWINFCKGQKENFLDLVHSLDSS